MERIKQALERAKSENKQKPSFRGQQPAASDANAGSVSAFNEKVQYSDTAVIEIDKKLLKKNYILPETNGDEAATAYKILRTQIEHRLTANGWNTLAITSPGLDQGKTLTAINLSIALAREVHRTVLLVDLDFRNPSIHRRLGLNVTQGVTDYLLDDVPLSDLLINPGIDRLVILPTTRTIANSSELLSSPRMINLVEELKSRYPSRIIVFDLPPILMADDALAFCPAVDSTLLVIEEGANTKDQLVRCTEILGSIKLIGTVLNKAEERQPTYY